MRVRQNATQPSDPSYRLIPLTRNLVCKVSTEDFTWASQFNWQANHSRGMFYASRAEKVPGKKSVRHFPMHRELLGFPPTGVDHINGDTLDNRRSNLRHATQSENCCNSRIRKDNRSGLKGVSFDSKSGKWRAQIQIKRQKMHLGMFFRKEDAETAYVSASVDLHGDFRRTF